MNGLQAAISSSSAQFSTLTGFSLSNLVDFVWSQILVLIGYGLALIQATLPVLAVLASIGIVIGLVWAGFRFFRH